MANLKFVRSVWESFRTTSGLEPRLLNNLSITSSRPGRLTFTLPIEPHHTNRLGILHGGTLACLTDTAGSLALSTHGLFHTGVSTDLSVTYLASGGKVGDELHGEATCDRFGGAVAFTHTVFRDPGGGVVARGSHTKYIKKARAGEGNRVGEDGFV